MQLNSDFQARCDDLDTVIRLMSQSPDAGRGRRAELPADSATDGRELDDRPPQIGLLLDPETKSMALVAVADFETGRVGSELRPVVGGLLLPDLLPMLFHAFESATDGQRCLLSLDPAVARRLLDGTLAWAEARSGNGLRAWVVDRDGTIAGHATWTPDRGGVLGAVFAVFGWLTRQAFLDRIDSRLARLERNTAEILEWLELEQRSRLKAHVSILRMNMAALHDGEVPDRADVRAILRESLEIWNHVREQFERAVTDPDRRGRCIALADTLFNIVQIRTLAAGLHEHAGLGAAYAREHLGQARRDLDTVRDEYSSHLTSECRRVEAKLRR